MRCVETKSIPASKQMYAKCFAPECWPYPEVRDHWDQLILRCWVEKGGERKLYQEDPLSTILSPRDLLDHLPLEGINKKNGLVLFSGTLATKGGLVFGDSYALELADPVLNRSIKYTYKIKILPQYI